MRLTLLLLLSSLAPAQTSGIVTLTTDWPAQIEIDGQNFGSLARGESLSVALSFGDHEIAAKPQPGGPFSEFPVWRDSTSLSPDSAATIAIPLRAHLLQTDVRRKGYWKHDRTNLLWAAADNGFGVTVSQARAYCGHLVISGLRGWRLPEIDELQSLYRGLGDEPGLRPVLPLKLSGWAWSETTGNESAEKWALDFADGARASVAAGDAGLNRALCVRSDR